MADLEVDTYVNQAGFADRIGIVRQPMTHRMQRGAVPEPDVVIGNVLLPGGHPGWRLERVNLYVAYEQLLRKLFPGHGRSLDVFFSQRLPSWWHADTEWFLSQAETAKVLGYEPNSITMGMVRGTFPVRPKISIGEKSQGSKRGWDLYEILTFGRQNRQVDEDGNVCDVARNGPPRKVVDPNYWERVSARRRTSRIHKNRYTSGISDELPIAA